MFLASFLRLALALTPFVVASFLSVQVPQRPTFTARTDVALIDVQVVTNDGTPIIDLSPADFIVELNGDRRRIVSVDLVRYDGPAARDTASRADVPRSADAAMSAALERRQYILAVDETSFSTLAALAWKEASKRFVERLHPDDLAGLYAYPVGGSLVPLTDDRAAIVAGVDGIVGRLDPRSRGQGFAEHRRTADADAQPPGSARPQDGRGGERWAAAERPDRRPHRHEPRDHCRGFRGGLDRFAGMARGELIRVEAGTGDYAFERVLRETSAYYLIAIEPDARDRDGRPHRVRVRVNRRGAIVRSRAYVVVPTGG